ncbi:MAG: PPC domain-containing protein [Planctomycetaceae bacterium]
MLKPERISLGFANHQTTLKQLINLKLVFLVLLSGLFTAGSAVASSPGLNTITPRSVPRGGEVEISFHGGRLADAQEILFYDSGFEVVEMNSDANKVIAKVKVAADCRLGEHVAHVRTASGLSEYRTFWVGALPLITEAEPNSEFATPQAISMNTTVQGIAQNEDVDYFVVEAKQGERISAEVLGMRLSTTLFDPYVAILDEKRFELSSADDSPVAVQDCVASIVAPADGKYIIEVRESSYAGNGNCNYILHVGNFPAVGHFSGGWKTGRRNRSQIPGCPWWRAGAESSAT